jgi:hypothetical protein
MGNTGKTSVARHPWQDIRGKTSVARHPRARTALGAPPAFPGDAAAAGPSHDGFSRANQDDWPDFSTLTGARKTVQRVNKVIFPARRSARLKIRNL